MLLRLSGFTLLKREEEKDGENDKGWGVGGVFSSVFLQFLNTFFHIRCESLLVYRTIMKTLTKAIS